MSDLHRIQSAPSADNSAIKLHASDNVAIARVPLYPGAFVVVDGMSLRVGDAIPAGHKVALTPVSVGQPLLRYGAKIGIASQDIPAGAHVHSHNVALPSSPALSASSVERTLPLSPTSVPTFQGYSRSDGRVGTRNYVAVGAVSNCAAHASLLIASHFATRPLPPNIDGVVAFPHGEGCGHSEGPDTRQLHRTIHGVMRHPNVGAGLLIGLGCEMNQVSSYAPEITGITLQSSGGTRAVVAEGIREVERLLEQAATTRRTPQPVSKLVLGLNCGGSDSFSGITCNPALGSCVDSLSNLGGTAVLAETTEIFGAESLLLDRARNRQVAQKLIDRVEWYKAYLARFGGSHDDNPSPGNKQGGLTNIIEKSLGAVAKGGTAILADVVDYAEAIPSIPGLVFMNTPGYDPVSLTGLAAGGVNLIVFTTGRGSAIGFPTVPVLKVSSNTTIYDRMRDNIDVNAGSVMDGTASVEQVGAEIFAQLISVASGSKTSSEILGHQEFVPWRIGPVL